MKYDIYHHEFDGNDAQARNISDAMAAVLKADERVAVSFGFEHQNPVLVLALPYSPDAPATYDVTVDNIHIGFDHIEVYDDEAGQPHGDIVDEPAPSITLTNGTVIESSPDVPVVHGTSTTVLDASTESEQPSEQPAPAGEW